METKDRPTESRARSRWHRRAAVVPTILTGCAIAGECGGLHWFPDLFSHFQVQYLAIASFMLVVSALLKRWRVTGLTLVTVFWFAWQVSPLWLDKKLHANTSANLRVVSINVYAGNSNFEKVAEVIRAANADIVVVQEVTAEWRPVLESLTDVLPHHRIVPRPDAFGITVLSRLPFKSLDTRMIGEVPWMEADFDHEEYRFRLLAAHTLPPMGTAYATTRNLQLGEIVTVAKRARHQGLELVVAGDLNCTPWSPWMKTTLGESDLRSARNGFGIAASWPTNRGPLIIPIDHVLVSQGIRVNQFGTGERTGSDHLPVIADLVLPKSSAY